MFAQCKKGDHVTCPKTLPARYVMVCDCPCHNGRPIPQNPCTRCHGTGYHGPVAVEGGVCFQCEGSGEEPKGK